MPTAPRIIASSAVTPQPEPTDYILPTEYGAQPIHAFSCDMEALKQWAPAKKWRRSGRSQRFALAAVGRAIDGFKTYREGDRALDLSEAVLHLGSALGEPDDTTIYLRNMIEQEEAAPMPAKFINSVPSSLATQTAIAYGIAGETLVHSHGVISFELALRQTMRHLLSGDGELGIVGAADALTPDTVAIGRERGWYQGETAGESMTSIDRMLLPTSGRAKVKGTIPGEGAAAFILSNNKKSIETAMATPFCHGVIISSDDQMGAGSDSYKFSAEVEAQWIKKAWGAMMEAPQAWFGSISRLTNRGKDEAEIVVPDLLITGKNGDYRFDARYEQILASLRLDDPGWSAVPAETYKQKCGEFCTAAALALQVGCEALITRGEGSDEAPVGSGEGSPQPGRTNLVGIYHYYPVGYRTLMAISSQEG